MGDKTAAVEKQLSGRPDSYSKPHTCDNCAWMFTEYNDCDWYCLRNFTPPPSGRARNGWKDILWHTENIEVDLAGCCDEWAGKDG